MGVGLCAAALPASAQTVTPMKQIVPTFTDQFVVEVQISNPYRSAQLSEIVLYTDDWTPIDDAVLSHRSARLGSGDKLKITVLVPMVPGRKVRHVYLCHSITPRTNGQGAAYKGEVCGKFSALRLS